jgi:Ca-activated chloride channel family protein
MNRIAIIWLIFFFSCFSLSAQELDQMIQAGNEFYKQGRYTEAVEKYNQALKKDPNNSTVKYNLALALHKTDKKAESVKLFNELSEPSYKNEDLRSKSFYNEGAVLSSQKKLEESIDAYKNALRLNPDDKEARENLQKTLLELKKKNEKPPPQPKKQQSQSKLNPKQTEQKLNQLEQKEKQVQQRVQQQKSKSGSSQPKDW